MRFTGLIVIAAALIIGVWTTPVRAHVLESDGSISAVLHMPPDDSPIAGQTTAVGLTFNSDKSSFSLKDYTTQVRILRDDKSLAVSQLQTDSDSSHDGSAVITFPETGAYRLLVTGTPAGNQPPFELYFSVRAVAGAGMKTDNFGQAGFDVWILSLGSLILLTIIARYNIQKGQRYR